MRLETTVTDELEARLEALEPWMHPFQLGPETFVGLLKYAGLGTTVVTRASPPELRERYRAAFDAYMEGDPYYEIRELARLVGDAPRRSLLDIASATGAFTFAARLEGFRARGVEIRPEQVEQARLIASLDPRLHDVEFVHDPTSADDPAYRDGEEHDIVLSLGLLYHLVNPLQHLANLRRLAREAAMVRTLTHAGPRGVWTLGRESPAGITKAVSGIAMRPHPADVPALLREAGFSRVETIVAPSLKSLQEPVLRQRDRSPLARAGRAVAPGAATTAFRVANERRRQRLTERLLRLHRNPAYYTYVAWV
jgi:hypothetical protein